MRPAMLLGVLGLALCSMGLGTDERPKPRAHTVTIEGMRFQPDHLTVAQGDTIVWVNKDVVAHTATSESGSFDSKIIEAGKNWKITVKKRGEFTYICTLHPTMKATVRVR